ncbi:ankyrin repeat domain-containing protein [Croceivirga thetidis]|uniref:Uncharacterized protein n=1 Tax=Croceivirga thetidis TaxID=2721623 RepID=A0ABX1GPG9_9FLAO|nr:ankyrin repeat domain-containing protein [Croceivirga thetidis]NKI31831.1 hypothetical protein [Croceivirga thetidis]
MKTTALVCLFLAGLYTANSQTIYRTACQGNIARLDSLLITNDINTQDQRGRSLLHWAVGCGKNEMFEHLVNKGIDLNLEDNEGATPLYMAVRFQNEVLFNRLVELLPDTSWKPTYGGLLFEKAILNRDLNFVQNLTVSGIDLDVTNSKGSTPLEIAMRIQADSITDWLKANGAKPELVRKIVAKGPYLGQEPPGSTAKVFAPNFISTEEYEFGSVFNKAGTEFYYGVDTGNGNEIRYSRLEGEEWSKPFTLLAHERYGYNDPFLSPDEKRLYFISNRTIDGQGEAKDIDIWYIEKEGNGWSQPINAGPNINSEKEEYYISFTNEGTMYFASDKNQSHHDIYFSKYVDGEFQKAVKLGEAINTEAYEADVFVNPNEQYLIFCAQRNEGMGRGDLYISFKQTDGSWSTSVNMGEKINSEGHELCPFVTADGNYLFYTSKQDIYWISTSVFETLK